jgi:hypothetical protein
VGRAVARRQAGWCTKRSTASRSRLAETPVGRVDALAALSVGGISDQRWLSNAGWAVLWPEGGNHGAASARTRSSTDARPGCRYRTAREQRVSAEHGGRSAPCLPSQSVLLFSGGCGGAQPSSYRARGTSESTAPEAEPEPDDAEEPGWSPCRKALIRWEKYLGLEARPLTQTARDEESEAE